MVVFTIGILAMRMIQVLHYLFVFLPHYYFVQLDETDGSSAIPPAVLRILNFKACRGNYISSSLFVHNASFSPSSVSVRLTFDPKWCIDVYSLFDLGAIMFGDPLLPSECCLIIEELKATSLCFQVKRH